MSAIDKDVLDTMTDEERAILESDEWKEDQDASVKRPDMREGDESDDEDEDDDAAEPEQQAAAEVVAENPVTDAVQEASEDEPAPAAEVSKTVYRASLPADYSEQVQALADEDSALADKFRAGELDFDEFRTQSAELNARRHELSMVRVKAEISQEMKEQTADAIWEKTIETFIETTKKAEGVDYLTDTAKQKDLDRYLKALAADDDNADKPMNWFLEEAHRIVRAKYNIQSPASQSETPSTKRPAPLSQVPKTLASVPGTDGPGDVGGDEFQDIDRLEGFDTEESYARLSPAARAKYLSAA